MSKVSLKSRGVLDGRGGEAGWLLYTVHDAIFNNVYGVEFVGNTVRGAHTFPWPPSLGSRSNREPPQPSSATTIAVGVGRRRNATGGPVMQNRAFFLGSQTCRVVPEREYRVAVRGHPFTSLRADERHSVRWSHSALRRTSVLLLNNTVAVTYTSWW